MFELLSTLITLDIASTLSPGIFALVIVLLGGKWHAKSRALALLIGILLVGICSSFLGFRLGNAANPEQGQNQISALIDIGFGLIFIFFGAKVLVAKDRKIKTSSVDTGKQIIKWLVLGIVLAATNFDALFLNFTAGKQVGQAIGIDFWEKILLLVFNLIFFILPALLPLAVVILFPVIAVKILQKLNFYVIKYSKYLIFFLFLLLGLMFIRKGLVFFI